MHPQKTRLGGLTSFGQLDDAERDSRVAEDLLALSSIRRRAISRTHDPPDDLDHIAVAVVPTPRALALLETPPAVLDPFAWFSSDFDASESLAEWVEEEGEGRSGEDQVDRRG